jgi:transposase-like protein
MLEAPDLGNEDGVMPKEQSPGKPTTRRYSPEEKASAVRMVRALREELGTDHGTVQRVARQLGYGIESVRSWVRRADIDDGHAPGVPTGESQRVKDLEQEVRELKRANEILKRAASFFGAELDRQHKK